MTLPGTLLALAAIFYGVVLFRHASIGQVQDAGWLIAPAGASGSDGKLQGVSFDAVDWRFVLSVLPILASLVVLSTIQTLLNVTALEVGIGRELDADAELRATGIANLVAASAAGIPTYVSLSSSLLAWRAGTTTRWAGLLAGTICLAFAVAGPQLIGYMPKIVLGAVIFMEAIDRLYQWLYEQGRRMGRFEYATLLAIFGSIIFIGFLQGIVLGFLIVVVVFVVKYSRISPVKSVASLETTRSSVARSPIEQELLAAQGHRVLVLRLQGFVFFGTASNLLRELKEQSVLMEGRRGHVLVDFRAVTGLDSSAGFQFTKIVKWLATRNAKLVLTDLSPAIVQLMTRAGVIGGAGVTVFPHLDHALEWSENELLHEGGILSTAMTLAEQLTARLGDTIKAQQLLPYLEPLCCDAGECIIAHGEASRDIYFIESGACSAVISTERGTPLRLRKFGPGALFGEMALYTSEPRTASVVADTAVRLHRMSPAALTRLAQENPTALSIFHELLARTMAERIAFQNRQLAMH